MENRLMNLPAYQEKLQKIKEQRDHYIRQLFGQKKDDIMQISGCIVACDDIVDILEGPLDAPPKPGTKTKPKLKPVRPKK